MKRLAFLLIILSSLMGNVVLADGQPTAQLILFSTEQQAQQHCPKDTVVWLNTPTGVYHFKGQRWYANTKSGAFVCQQEADKAGDRATRNGQ